MRRWLSSFLLIGGTAVLLLLTMRHLGPSGSGVPAMLQMQSAWESASCLHAAGLIQHNSGVKQTSQQFELWQREGNDRWVQRVDSTSAPDRAAAPQTTVAVPGAAWAIHDGQIRPLDANRDNLFPLPDPACGSSYYRWVQRWTVSRQDTVAGHACEEVTGSGPGVRVLISLDRDTHLPRSIRIIRQNAAHDQWRVNFTRISTADRIPTAVLGVMRKRE